MNGENLSRPYSQYDIDYALNELLDSVGVRTPWNGPYFIKAKVTVEEVSELLRGITAPKEPGTPWLSEEDRLRLQFESEG